MPDSTRVTIIETINGMTSLRELGLPADAVFQADTLESPNFFPFIVVRFLPEIGGVGPVSRRPFDLWGYDKPGSYTRIERILRKAAEELHQIHSVQTESGWISLIAALSTRQADGLGRDADLYDDGYEAVVIPWHCYAVASGL